MSFYKKSVNNRKIYYRYNRRAIMTSKMSKIERRREKLDNHKSLYGKLYYMTRDKADSTVDKSMAFGFALVMFFVGYMLPIFVFSIWAAIWTDIMPVYLGIATLALSTWLVTIKSSYKAYYIMMDKYYAYQLDKLDTRRDKILPDTFMYAFIAAMGKTDESSSKIALFTLSYPERIGNMYLAYKNKVDDVDSLRHDPDDYRKGLDMLTDIFEEDLRDVHESEKEYKKARKAEDKRISMEIEQEKRAETEQRQNVLNDLRTYRDTYLQTGK